MNIDNIQNISIIGFNKKDNMYKIQLDFNDVDDEKIRSQKLYLGWDEIFDSFKHIKKELNTDIYSKLRYTLCSSIVIKDDQYKSTKEFLNGVPGKKNIRKITDIQKVFDFLLKNRNDPFDKNAINCVLRHAFDVLE